MEKVQADLLVKHAAELATPVSSGLAPAEFQVIHDGGLAARDGEIVAVGPTSEVMSSVQPMQQAQIIDASGMTVTPGLVDCHTHPIFFGGREDEFEMRVAGKSYEQIALAGGGIKSSVRKLRTASKTDLLEAALPRLDRLLSLGTTTIEAKSGYGLSVADEVKMLEVIKELNRVHTLEIVPTFLGAHEVPDEFRSDKKGYMTLVTNEMLPKVREAGLAEYCDIFCEDHVFTVEESRAILLAAQEAGFGLKIHAEQLTRIGGAAMAAELGAVSADHLDYCIEEDWIAMAKHGVVPVVLPGAVHFLGKTRYADARAMWDIGLPVALATDLNPGSCMSESMPMMMNLACIWMGLKPSETLIAATQHAAMAIGRGNFLGSLEVGKKADLVLWRMPNHKHLAYHFGVNLVDKVIKDGLVCTTPVV